MSQHTREPWQKNHDDIFVGGDIHDVVASCHFDDNHDGRANARRIVACVNACAEFPTETLEQKFAGKMLVGSGVHLWMSYTDKKAEAEELKEQRDELLTALKSIADDICDNQYTRIARAAIDKVKP
jgi:hypothetical protein